MSQPRFLLADFKEVPYEHEGEAVVSYQATVTDRETEKTQRNAVRLRYADDQARVLGRDLLKSWAEEWGLRALHPHPLNSLEWEAHFGDPAPCQVCDGGHPEIEVEESPK